MVYKLKTKLNNESVKGFIEALEDAGKKEDAFKLLDIFTNISGEEAKMWGTSIIGFGKYHYKYDSGQEGDFIRTGFSPRKNALSIYIIPGYEHYQMQELLNRLGKHKLGKSCLYIKKLEDIDMGILEKIISEGLKKMKDIYG